MNAATKTTSTPMKTVDLLASLSLVVECNTDIAPCDIAVHAVFIENEGEIYPLSVAPNKTFHREVSEGKHQFIFKFDTDIYDVRSFFHVFYNGSFNYALGLDTLTRASSIAHTNVGIEKPNNFIINDIFLTSDDIENKHSRDAIEHSITVLNSNKY